MKRGRGHIELIIGPMFSGKSTELMRRIKKLQFADRKCIVYNYEASDSLSAPNFLQTHD